jgi:hypothetical protein
VLREADDEDVGKASSPDLAPDVRAPGTRENSLCGTTHNTPDEFRRWRLVRLGAREEPTGRNPLEPRFDPRREPLDGPRAQRYETSPPTKANHVQLAQLNINVGRGQARHFDGR